MGHEFLNWVMKAVSTSCAGVETYLYTSQEMKQTHNLKKFHGYFVKLSYVEFFLLVIFHSKFKANILL